MTVHFGCEGCGKFDPLLESDGRALCVRCLDVSPDLAAVDRQVIAALRVLTALTDHQDPDAN